VPVQLRTVSVDIGWLLANPEVMAALEFRLGRRFGLNAHGNRIGIGFCQVWAGLCILICHEMKIRHLCEGTKVSIKIISLSYT
jgi:hypothetical protein